MRDRPMHVRPAKLLKDLLADERTGGVLLVACTVCSLLLANSTAHAGYTGLWHIPIAGRPVEFWINDGLMTVFFLLIGLELKREVRVGALSTRRQALLPVIAAVGGMLVPAGIHVLFNVGTPTAAGAGIPMATDIAFAVAILALLGDRVPPALKAFLLALAVIDDLGAILVIAVFYAQGVAWAWLGAALALFGLLLLLGRRQVNAWWPYLLLGLALWCCMLRSGVHATISGVLLAAAIPFGDGGERTLAHRLQHALHRPVAFAIMPLFALANTCIVLAPGWTATLATPNSLGILFGLVLGKPAGILLFSAAAIAVGWCLPPTGTRRIHLLGVGCLGGIGFTMSIFITLLAFPDAVTTTAAKTAILGGSLLSALFGAALLRSTLPGPAVDSTAA